MRITERVRVYLREKTEYFIPSWIILLMDVVILLFSFTASYTLRYNFQVPADVVDRMYRQFLPLILLSVVVFLAVGIHKSVIRHTGLKDVIMVVKAVFFAP